MKEKQRKCCLCGGPLYTVVEAALLPDWKDGNNAWPLADGRYCTWPGGEPGQAHNSMGTGESYDENGN